MSEPIEKIEDENFTPTEVPDTRVPKADPKEEPIEDIVEPVEDAVPVEKAEEKPEHPAELVAQAARAGITDEEIAEMSGPELKRYIRQTERLNQRFEERVAKIAPVEAKVEPSPYDELEKQLDDEAEFDPNHATTKLLKLMVADNKQLKAKVAAIEPAVRSSGEEKLDANLNAALDKIAPEFSKDFDLSTPEGRDKRQELWGMMAAIQAKERASGRVTNLETHARQAAKALDFVPTSKQAEKAKKAEEFEKHTKEYDEGALAPAVNRKPSGDVVSEVQKILDRRNRRERTASAVQWND
jgi:hypothetical protein